MGIVHNLILRHMAWIIADDFNEIYLSLIPLGRAQNYFFFTVFSLIMAKRIKEDNAQWLGTNT